MLKIWGRATSLNAQKVLWCCDEIGLSYERIDAGLAYGVVDTPAYRKLNPNGLVPTIDEDGFVLWESQAIIRYLAGRYALGSLCPADPRTRALADQWMDWNHTAFWPLMRPVFAGLVRTPPEKRDMAAIEDGIRKSGAILRILDEHLASHAYVTGDSFTMGDIPLGCGVYRFMALPIDRPSLPNLERWSQAIAKRPAFCQRVALPLS